MILPAKKLFRPLIFIFFFLKSRKRYIIRRFLPNERRPCQIRPTIPIASPRRSPSQIGKPDSPPHAEGWSYEAIAVEEDLFASGSSRRGIRGAPAMRFATFYRRKPLKRLETEKLEFGIIWRGRGVLPPPRKGLAEAKSASGSATRSRRDGHSQSADGRISGV
jgi:hypothetical protein